jgi:hypothetical protein
MAARISQTLWKVSLNKGEVTPILAIVPRISPQEDLETRPAQANSFPEKSSRADLRYCDNCCLVLSTTVRDFQKTLKVPKSLLERQECSGTFWSPLESHGSFWSYCPYWLFLANFELFLSIQGHIFEIFQFHARPSSFLFLSSY